MVVKEEDLDLVLIPMGLLVMLIYHGWLVATICRTPERTIIGLNAAGRHHWVICMMADPTKTGILAVQTMRNSIMASTLLATTGITISSIIATLLTSNSHNSKISPSRLVFGNTMPTVNSIKYFSIILCFLVASLCNVVCIRYYAQVSILISLPCLKEKRELAAYVARGLNRGSLFWSLGLRAFYLSFPLFLWIFGPIPMFLCCCLMPFLLYFLDTATGITRQLHICSFGDEKEDAGDATEILIHHQTAV